MNQTKPASQSLTINSAYVGIAATVVYAVLRALGVDVAEEEVTQVVAALFVVATFVLTIIGRRRATARIE